VKKPERSATTTEREVQNITLALPKWLLRKVKHLAVEREKSISRLLAETLEEMVARNDAYDTAKERARRLLKNPPDLGTFDRNWTRDELHER
jgi:hypothetical protein